MEDFTPGNEPLDYLKSEQFLEILLRSKLELDKLINGYVAMHRLAGQERVIHGLTNDRRNMLRSIMAKDRRDMDEDGNHLIRWDIMLEYAYKAVEAFNREDIQR